MGKENEVKFDPLDIQAKKKKTKLIVFVVVGLVSVIVISVGSSLLSVDETKVFEKRKAKKEMSELQVIKNPEIKENWAIAIENRVDKQEGLLKESAEKQKHEKDIILSQLKDIIETRNSEMNEKIEMIKEEQKRKTDQELNRLKKELKIQSDKVNQLELMRGSGGGINANTGIRKDIVLGKEMLPIRRPAKIEKDTMDSDNNSDTSEVKEPSFDANEELRNILSPERDTEKTLEKIDELISQDKEDKAKEASDNTSYNPSQGSLSDQMAATGGDNTGGMIDTPQVVEKERVNLSLVNVDTSFNKKIINESKKIIKENINKAKPFESYHVSTGFTQAYMLTGAYAPAFQEGTSKPLPVMLRAEGDILMANNTYGDVENCFLLGTAKGNMNSQTADIRLVSINCLIAGGKYRIEGAISGWVIGENGIPGVKGELIHKNGALLARSFVAGFLESAATIMNSSASSSISGSDTNVYSSDTLSNSASQSAGDVFSKIADYYTKMAEQIFPVIEVKGGRTISILLTGGEDLTVTENNIPLMAHMTQTAEDLLLEKETVSDVEVTINNNAFVRATTGGTINEAGNNVPGTEGEIPDFEGGIR